MKSLKREIIEAILLTALFFALVPFAKAGQVNHPQQTTMWVAYGPDGTIHNGTTESNQVTVSGQPNFFQTTNAMEYASTGTVIGVTNWPAMPEIGEWVDIGAYAYSNEIVAVYQAHTRQADWLVESTPALYGIYHGAGTAVAEWVQPTGAHDAYQTGDQVLFGGEVYTSLIDANVWSPTAYARGWEKQ